VEYRLPLFMPVYQSNTALVTLDNARRSCDIQACMVNAYFLYKNRELRRAFKDGLSLREHVGFPGLLMTDSGAFQGFARRLLLSNSTIIKFQEQIATDISSPLDIVTPPGDSRRVAKDKMTATLKRIAEGLQLVSHSVLTGVQQGGRFRDLRRQNMEQLVSLGCRYIALGSLVPFFNANHDLTFVGQVIRDARSLAEQDVPLHVYGAGDPVELPVMVAMGADVFDSSSYAHYARRGQYMTPFGALSQPGRLTSGEYVCGCGPCQNSSSPDLVFQDVNALAAHNLWTICMTIRKVQDLLVEGRLHAWIDETLKIHQAWFPESRLTASWSALNE
jgi:7-cyano-7-deazaguanine tRNA-ribosyltransferase